MSSSLPARLSRDKPASRRSRPRRSLSQVGCPVARLVAPSEALTDHWVASGTETTRTACAKGRHANCSYQDVIWRAEIREVSRSPADRFAAHTDRSPSHRREALDGHKRPVASRTRAQPRRAHERQVSGAESGAAIGSTRPRAVLPDRSQNPPAAHRRKSVFGREWLPVRSALPGGIRPCLRCVE